ncbi:hypothetical protein EAK04_05395 [Escherichia coli]|nr:hypothetical protein [Escherichia coli]EFC4580959.1 hypothetical protein [Escherichia coli]EFF2984837.1 hypothetical protein [Escherichia coli]EFO0991793.1 hypothetical protein [Escherichia coli]
MLALVLWNPALPLVLATLPLIFPLTPSSQPTVCTSFLTDSSFVTVSFKPSFASLSCFRY